MTILCMRMLSLGLMTGLSVSSVKGENIARPFLKSTSISTSKEYLEATLLKAFSNISSKINSLEDPDSSSHQKNFLVNTAIKLMEVTTQHFAQIVKVVQDPKLQKQYKFHASNPAYKVSNQVMFQAFGSLHHKGMPDPSLPKADQDAIRLNEFFKPFTQNLLELADLKSAEDLPLPAPARDEMWKVLQEQLLPEALQKLYDQLLEPHTMNLMFLNVLEVLNQALDAIPDDHDLPDKIDADPDQERLNEACGKLVLQLVNLVPQKMTKYLMKIQRVKVMVPRVIGRAVRRQLSQWTMLTLIDKALFKGLPQVVSPAKWEGKQGWEQLVKKEIFKDVDGKEKYKTTDLKFDFYKALDAKEMKATQKKLNATLTKTISTQLKVTISHFITTTWANFQKAFDAAVSKHLGNRGVKMKQFLDNLCHKIFFSFLGAGLQVLSYPFNKVLWFFIDLHISRKSNEIIRDLHMNIHESLFYHLTDTLMEQLKKKPENALATT